jgi:DNA-binding XRE family transcriptional regulator
MSQPEVAKVLGVTTDTIAGWELNRHQPMAGHAKRIIEFLGYVPRVAVSDSLGSNLRMARQVSGLTQRQAAKTIGCDPLTLRLVELGIRKSHPKTHDRIQSYIDRVLHHRFSNA